MKLDNTVKPVFYDPCILRLPKLLRPHLFGQKCFQVKINLHFKITFQMLPETTLKGYFIVYSNCSIRPPLTYYLCFNFINRRFIV
jgi:hypothetical protein